MPFDVDQLAQFASQDFLRGNHYKVMITNPITGTTSERLGASCQSLDLPGTFFATYERRQKGPLIKLPNDRVFVEANLTFYQQSDAEARKYFQAWHDSISEGDNFKFFEEYKGEGNIWIYNRQHEKVLTVTLQDCWPIFINAVALGYDNKEVETMTVGLQAYRITVE